MRRAGFKTTEFWLALAVALFIAHLAESGVYPPEKAVTDLLGILVGYGGLRGAVKIKTAGGEIK